MRMVKKEDLKYTEIDAEFGGGDKKKSAVKYRKSVLKTIVTI